MIVVKGWDVDVKEYVFRLKVLRRVIADDNQIEFASRIGIDMKRWNNYERGYPVPREVAFILIKKFPGLSVEWIWFGWTGNLSPSFKKKIEDAEVIERQHRDAQKALKKAKAKVKDISRKVTARA